MGNSVTTPGAQVGAVTAGSLPPGNRRRRLHPAWIVAGVSFVALIGAAGFRSAPGVLMVPMQDEFGWSRTLLSVAVGINLVLYGLTAWRVWVEGGHATTSESDVDREATAAEV